MTEKIVKLNIDQKKTVLNELKDIIRTSAQISKWIEQDSLTLSMVGDMVGLVEFQYTDIAKILGYETHLIKERDERYHEIRDVKNRNYELEQMIASLKPIEGLKEQLNQLSNIVSEWWKSDGFDFVSDFRFYSGGSAAMKFCFMLNNGYSSGITSTRRHLTKDQYIKQIKENGYEIKEIEGTGLVVLDTLNNRMLLRNLLVDRFPSIRLNSFGNHAVGKHDDIYILDGIDATIFDLRDIPLI
jgi:hypothetical protein